MRRDLDLIRSLLLAVEARPPGSFRGSDIAPPDEHPAIVAEHLLILMNAGFIEGLPDQTLAPLPSPARIEIDRLTWEGHDLLAAIRADSIWERTKERVIAIGGSVSLEVVKRIATDYALGKLS